MRVPLLGGAYTARSYIANAQRCINLYPEQNAKDAPVPVTHYPTAGLTSLIASAVGNGTRCLFRSSQNQLFQVLGNSVYYISPLWVRTLLGTIGTNTGYVSMQDNGLYAVIVDGSANGYYINLSNNGFGQISDPAFYGANFVDYVDTYFLFNQPGTNKWYISPSNWIPGVPFDPLAIASKTAYPDPIQALIVMHREVWLIGTLTTEIWYDSGAADFAFQILPGVYIEHGCVAPASLIKIGLILFWLSQDERGEGIVMKGESYAAQRISTHAIEQAIAGYSVISDAVGCTYQYDGHVFYELSFPTANATWTYDQTIGLWHEGAWTDANGNLNRTRKQGAAFAYGVNVCGDWQNGNLYQIDQNNYTDNGNPISRIRAFPQIIENNKNARQNFNSFIADMDVGQDINPADTPQVLLRWSNDKGNTWGNAVPQSLGNMGQYSTNIKWNRLGMSRDRVYELSWSVNAKTALNGAFIDQINSRT